MAELSESARTLLQGRHYAVLATHDADGSIYLTPIWYIFRRDRVFVGAHSASRKVRNIVERPNASLIVDIRKPGSEKWVSVSGPATILRGDEAKQINADIQKRYLTEEALQDPKIGPTFASLDDVSISIHPTRWRSWSSKDLDAQFFGGILGPTPQKWFRPVD